MPWLIYIEEREVYIRMSEGEQDLIDKGKQQGASALEYVWPTEDKHGKRWFTKYVLDLEQNVQTNTLTNKKRRFGFFSGSSLANSPLLAPRAPMIYIDEKDVYIRMTNEEQYIIELMNEHGVHGAEYVWPMKDKHDETWYENYELDLEQNVQTNTRTGKKRPFGFFS